MEKGKLVRWIGDKRFGFIKLENGTTDILIHISALREMSRPPVIGDVIYFELVSMKRAKYEQLTLKLKAYRKCLR